MTLADSFEDLMRRLDDLLAVLRDVLQWAVTQGKPATDDHVLASRYEEMATELIARTEEARCIANAGKLGLTGQDDFAGAGRALVSCQECVNGISRTFFSDIVSFEALADLDNLAAEQQEHWGPWVRGVRDALDQCWRPIEAVNESLIQCWKSLTERISLVSVPAQTLPAVQEKSSLQA